jgi:protein-disulfide isomerase
VGPSVKTFQARYPNDVQIVFKQFPLSNIHADAQLAAEASVEAGRQGKFWAFHDRLFLDQKALARPHLERYAEQLELDMVAFKKALDERSHQAVVAADLRAGQQAGVRATPTMFINGRKYQGPRGYPPEGLEAVGMAYFGLK